MAQSSAGPRVHPGGCGWFDDGSMVDRSTEENTEKTMAAELLYRWMLRCSASKEEN
jgi:hypothetical protein